MQSPGVMVSMQEGWRGILDEAIEKLRYDIVTTGYSDGSKVWNVGIEISRKFDITEFEKDLRDALDYQGWIDIKFYDFSDY